MTDKNKTALFIGNRDCYQVKEADIEKEIINAIENGIEIFLNGGQGYFDKTCASIVHRINFPGASTKVSTGHFTRAQRGRGISLSG